MATICNNSGRFLTSWCGWLWRFATGLSDGNTRVRGTGWGDFGAKWHLPLTTLTEAATRSCSIMQVDNGNTMDTHGSKLWHPLQVRFPPWTSPKSSRKFHHQDTSKPFKTNIRQPRWLDIKLGRLLQTTRLPSCDSGENYALLRRHLHERTELEWLQGLEVLILPDSAGVAWMAEAWGYDEDMLMEFLWVIDKLNRHHKSSSIIMNHQDWGSRDSCFGSCVTIASTWDDYIYI